MRRAWLGPLLLASLVACSQETDLQRLARERGVESYAGPHGPRPTPRLEMFDQIGAAPTFELYLVDDESDFPGTGAAYFELLSREGHFAEAPELTVIEMGGYGRDGGAHVEVEYAVMAREKSQLEVFFAGLPEDRRLPESHRIGYGMVSLTFDPRAEPEAGWRAWVLRSPAALGGHHLAEVGLYTQDELNWFSSLFEEPHWSGLSLTLTDKGKDVFARISADNVGRKIAIVLDGMVFSDPVVNEPIPGGVIALTMGHDVAPDRLPEIMKAWNAKL